MRNLLLAVLDVLFTLPQLMLAAWMFCRLLPMRRPACFTAAYTLSLTGLHVIFTRVLSFHYAPQFLVVAATMLLVPCLFSKAETSKTCLLAILTTVLFALTEFVYAPLWVWLSGNAYDASLLYLPPLDLAVLKVGYLGAFFVGMSLLYLGWKRLVNHNRLQNASPFLLFVIGQCISLLVVGYLLLDSGENITVAVMAMAVIMLLCAAADGALLYTVRQTQERYAMEARQLELEQRLELQEAHRRQTAAGQARVAEVRREITGRLEDAFSLLRLGEPGRARAEIDRAAQRLKATRGTRWCENQIVDAVMEEKYGQCQALSISLEGRLALPAYLDLDGTQLCSLFSNVMDNAIAACSRLPEGARWIRCSAGCEEGYLILKAENPQPPKEVSRREKDALLPRHGLGLEIIRDLARRRQGQVEVRQEEGRFTILVWLRLGPDGPAAEGAGL